MKNKKYLRRKSLRFQEYTLFALMAGGIGYFLYQIDNHINPPDDTEQTYSKDFNAFNHILTYISFQP